jgi:hypothetical protein
MMPRKVVMIALFLAKQKWLWPPLDRSELGSICNCLSFPAAIFFDTSYRAAWKY